MYKIVKTKEQYDEFCKMFKETFVKEKYETELFNGEAIRILVENKYGKYGGTLELVPYKPGTGYTTVEDMFDFSNLEVLKDVDTNKIYEIDKLSVLESERKNGTLDNIMGTLMNAAYDLDIHYFIALINPLLFRAIRVNYGAPVQKAGKLIQTKDYSIQPMYIDMKFLIENNSWDKNGLKKIWLKDKQLKEQILV